MVSGSARRRPLLVSHVFRSRHPGHVEQARAVAEDRRGIGVHLAAAREQRLVHVAPPGPRRLVVDVDEPLAVAAPAVAVEEEQSAVGRVEEAGIGAAPLLLAGHAMDGLERGRVARRLGAVVAQPHAVHVRTEVKLALAVEAEGDVVVAVPADPLARAVERPFRAIEGPAAHDHVPLVVVEADPQGVAVLGKGEADGVSRPHLAELGD